jgi:glutaredoxin
MNELYIVWGKDNCPFCDRAKALLTSKGLAFDYLTLGVDYDREELFEMAPNARTVPQIWYVEDDNMINDKDVWTYIGGYVELEKSFKNEVEVALDEGLILNVTFTKVDGTERTMRCTKNPDIISEVYTPTEKKTDRTRDVKPGLVSVFDLEKNDWRSFRLESVKGYTMELAE